MEIKRICIKNFLAISDATLGLSNKGLVLIQGENLDDTSADSNGTGKSSIVDALCWCLYGVTARGVSGDAVVNRIEKKDCSVVVYLKDGDARYSIQRTRKHKTLKNQTIVKLVTTNGETDLSRGTERETQKVINQVMGCSQEVFQAAVYSGQESMIDLPALTDRNLKLIVEEAAGIDRIEAAYALARSEMTEVSNRISEAEVKRDLYLDTIRTDKGIMLETRAAMTDWEKSHAEAVSLFECDLKAAESALEACQGDLKALDEESLIKQKKTLVDASDASRRKHENNLRQLATLSGTIAKTEANLEGTKEKAKEIARRVESYAKNPESFVCQTCGSPLSEEKIADMRSLDEEKLKGMANLIADFANTIDRLRADRDTLQKKIDGYTEADTSAVAMLTEKLARLSEAKIAVRTAAGNVDMMKQKLESARNAVNPHQNAYGLVVKRLKESAIHYKSYEKTISDLEGLLKLKKATVEVFSPAGVRALILDTVTPFLNQRTSEYLSVLSDGNLSAVWTTLSKTAKGDLREKFSIEVTNERGGDSFQSLSGGEKKKVRVATCMALQDLVSSRATKPVNLWIADEIDSALDVSGLERLMTVLNRRAMEKGTVVIISHTNLRDWCGNVITVRKESGVSTVEAD